MLNIVIDIHTLKAAKIFNVPPENVTKEQRQAGKTDNYIEMYSGDFGMGFTLDEFKGLLKQNIINKQQSASERCDEPQQ